jgi:hypothetical protein
MFARPAALAALLALSLAAPALAQEAPVDGCAAATPAAPAKPSRFGALLSAAGRAGVGNLLNGQAGQMLGSGKGGAVAGAVLGTALNAANTEGGAPQPSMMSMMTPFGGGGGRTAQIAGAVTGTAIELARASSTSAPCGQE